MALAGYYRLSPLPSLNSSQSQAVTMARNEEKSHAMLNKWLAMKQQFGEKKEQRRPFLASECSDLNEAEKWRREIVRDIVKKVSEIQNASLGEHAIRDLNDRINKLMRQRYAWERRIVELGGPNYTKSSKTYDAEGKELPGGGGYKYFGAARELPGVRELFQTEEHSEPAKRRRGDIYKRITPDYFGFRDEEDGVLLEKEASVERQKVEEADEVWK
jgi:pre-mRNA-splicing factor ISY1